MIINRRNFLRIIGKVVYVCITVECIHYTQVHEHTYININIRKYRTHTYDAT